MDVSDLIPAAVVTVSSVLGFMHILESNGNCAISPDWETLAAG